MHSLGLSSGMMMIFGSVILDLLQAAGTRRLSECTRTGTDSTLLKNKMSIVKKQTVFEVHTL